MREVFTKNEDHVYICTIEYGNFHRIDTFNNELRGNHNSGYLSAYAHPIVRRYNNG
jgi:hypothetical protein